MRKIYFKQLFTALLLLCSTIASAHDFEVDGIYYNILSSDNKTVEVTFRAGSYDSYYDEYSGAVTIPSSVIYNGETYSVTSIGEAAFESCNSLESVTIPNSVTSIGEAAFQFCNSLESVTIPNSVTSIGDYAFSGCFNFTSVTIGNGATSIARNAFHDCSNLENISVSNENATYDSRDNCNAIIETATNTLIAGCKNTIIPNSVTYIGGEAFYARSNLTSINIPNSVTDIGTDAFSHCINLTSITIPESVIYIGMGAFRDCKNLTSITIPNSVTYIGSQAFYDCSSLTSINIPESVTDIENGAFEGCESLDEVHITDLAAWCNIDFDDYNANPLCCAKNLYLNGTLVTDLIIPEGVTAIKNYAFSECSSLTSITIPNSVTSIGYIAFLRCYRLTSITIPENVTYIESGAFADCWNLTSITSLIPADKLYDLDGDVFERVDRDACTLYVPAGAKDTYAATAEWSTFKNIKEIIEEPFALTVSAARYATLYLDYDAVIPAGLRVYYAEKIEGETLLMERINDVIPANTGVIVTGAAGTYTFEQSLDNVAAIEKNLFRGSVEDTYITPEKGTKYYVLSMVDGVVGMYLDELAGGTFKNNAHKAYLPIFTGESLGIFDTTVNAPDVQLSNRYTFNFGGVTAVESITTTASDEAIYNLNGVRVENPTKGIYIVNGKKIVY